MPQATILILNAVSAALLLALLGLTMRLPFRLKSSLARTEQRLHPRRGHEAAPATPARERVAGRPNLREPAYLNK